MRGEVGGVEERGGLGARFLEPVFEWYASTLMSDSSIRGLIFRVSEDLDGADRCSLTPFAGFALSVFEDGGIGSFVTVALERVDFAFATTESSVSLAIT